MSEKIRLIKPAWNETLIFLVGMTSKEKSVELIEEISQSYLDARKEYLSKNSIYDFKTLFEHSRLFGECLIQKQYLHTHQRGNNGLEITVECENDIIREAAIEWLWASVNPYDLGRVSIPTPRGLVTQNLTPNLPHNFNLNLAHDLGIITFTSIAFEAYVNNMFKKAEEMGVPVLPAWKAIFKSLNSKEKAPYLARLRIMKNKGDQKAAEVLNSLCLESYLDEQNYELTNQL